MANQWWKEPEFGVPAGCAEWCAAARMWRGACAALGVPEPEEGWHQIVDLAPPDSVWHTLRNCVAYQAGVWQNLVGAGVAEAAQPAAFKLAIVLRHTPSRLTVRLLADMLRAHPHAHRLISYVLALLTDDEAAWCASCGAGQSPSAREAAREAAREVAREAGVEPGGAGEGEGEEGEVCPTRDLQLFGDCELAVLAARREEYDAHAKLVRAEYANLAQRNYVELRVKVLNQLSQVPRLYHTAEFECLEPAARENIEREINTLREHLLTGQHD